MFWFLFHLIIILFLIFDWIYIQKNKISLKFNIGVILFWAIISLIYVSYFYFHENPQSSAHFLSVYLLEKSLSVDNVFLFLIIFRSLKVPHTAEHKILLWGIIGAIFMRATFIYLGVELIEKFEFLFYIFGLLLLFSGYKIFKSNAHTNIDIQYWKTKLSRFLPFQKKVEFDTFWVRKNSKIKLTTAFLTLCIIELTDLIFAIDSIPASLGISQHMHIIYPANILAVLTLRAMYFVLRDMISHFKHINYGIGLVLIFIAIKMLLHQIWPISAMASLGVIGGILFTTFIYSYNWGGKGAQS